MNADSTTPTHAKLARPDLVGPELATTLSDDRWRAPSVRLIAGGKSNLTFEIISPAGSLILRRPPSGVLLPGAHDMGREARVQSALAGTDVPVAPVVLVDEGDLIGVPFYIMEKVEGHVIREDLPEGYAPTDGDKAAMSTALVDALAALHAVNPSEVGLGDFGKPDGFMARQIRTWTRQWQATKTREVPAMDELEAKLAHYDFVEPNRAAIVHGDYRFDNCIFAPTRPPSIGALLDWELCTLGDPLADLGMLLFYWCQPGESSPMLTPSLTAQAGFPSRDWIVEQYARTSGRDLRNLDAYVAFAHFKFAAIAQGIAARTSAGAMAGQDFGNLDNEVERIAVEGLDRLTR